MKLRIIRVDLPLKHVFATSRSSFSVVRTIVVELEQDGMRGHGEAYEDHFYGSDIEEMVPLIEKCRESVENYALADPTALWRHLEPILGDDTFARSAVDCAACDLWGKMKNKPLWKIWGLTKETCPAELSAEKTSEMQELAEKVFRVLRLKNYARMDFIMDEQGAVYCLEANTLPGMTPTSLLPQEAEAAGISFTDLCERIISTALEN